MPSAGLAAQRGRPIRALNDSIHLNHPPTWFQLSAPSFTNLRQALASLAIHSETFPDVFLPAAAIVVVGSRRATSRPPSGRMWPAPRD
jgi:hypothetical protein